MKKLKVDPKSLIFDLKVREMCKHCKRFGKKATCPPYIESVEYYGNLLSKYTFCVFCYEIFPVDKDAEAVGRESSLKIYKEVVSERNRLFSEGHYLILGLGAGSCKLCQECSFPCPKPGEALIPLEATGMDVVRVMGNLGIEIKFPIKDTICRVGAIFYD